MELGKAEDLTGKKFGRLTVIERAPDYIQPNNGRKRTQWKCVCDCQKNKKNPDYIIVVKDRLKGGNTRSCGCLAYETVTKNNIFIKHNDYYEGVTTKGESFFFDLDDYDIVSKYCWFTSRENYIVAYDKHDRKKEIRLHRLVMDVLDDSSILIDHIGGEKTRNDNRKINLRRADNSKNTCNTRIRKNNKSGHTGVIKGVNKWIAYICKDGLKKRLGSFDTFEEAVKAREEAEQELFGEWSYDKCQEYYETIKPESFYILGLETEENLF